MDLQALPTTPPPPSLVVTSWSGSRGQDLLGLRAPAERIANHLMNGVTTISPLIRYISFRSWVIHRYAALGGPNQAAAFRRFAGKCEAALVIGHKLSGASTQHLIGSREAARTVVRDGELPLTTLTENLAVDAYAGPSQDLAIALPIRPVPGLSTERGLPLALAAGKVLDRSPVLAGIDASTSEQSAGRDAAADLAIAFPLAAPVGLERELLLESVCPPKPLPGEFRRLAAYCYLLHLSSSPKGLGIDEEGVFRAVIGAAETTPSVLHPVEDGWLRFLVRDLIAAVHERAVELVLGRLEESPGHTLGIELALTQLSAFDFRGVLADAHLGSLTGDSSIGELFDAVRERCPPSEVRNGLTRWTGVLDELAILKRLADRGEPELLALLPVAWAVAYERTRNGLNHPSTSIDAHAGTPTTRLGVEAYIAPEVRSWSGSRERIRDVVARLTRRSVDQHLSIAWYRMQADPTRNVSLLSSDGRSWTHAGHFRAGRATSRLTQALSWLDQLALANTDGLTTDGTAVLERGLTSLREAGNAP